MSHNVLTGWDLTLMAVHIYTLACHGIGSLAR